MSRVRAAASGCVPLLAAALLCLAASATSLAADGADLVGDAARRLRLGKTDDALRLLEQAVAADPGNADAAALRQDLVRGTPAEAAVAADAARRAAERPDDPVAAYLRARLLPPKEASAEFEKQAARFQGSPWPRAGRARALLAQSNVPGALREYDAAVEADAANLRVRAERAAALEQAGKWDAALADWRVVAAARPNDAAARVGVAEALRRIGDLDGAAAEIGAVASAEPEWAEPPFRLGLVRFDQEKYADAVASFERALALRPTHYEALCAAATASLGRAADAAADAKKPLTAADIAPVIAFADRAVAAQPDRPEAYTVRASALESAGPADPELLAKALADATSAVDRTGGAGPARLRVLLLRSRIHFRTANFRASADDAEKATAIDPKSEDAWAAGGEALVAGGEADDATKRFWRPGLKSLPQSARLHHGYGLALFAADKLTDAARELREAVKLAPREGRYRLSYGELLYQSMKEKDAAPELAESVELRRDDRIAWACLAHAHVSNQKWTEAAEAYEKVCALDPAAVDEHLYLAVIYADRLNQKDKGRAHAATYRERGGSDAQLDVWLDVLLSDK